MTKNIAAKTTVEKTTVRKASPLREAFTTMVTELKTLTATKKAKKAEMLKKIDALWTEYRDFTKNEYKTKRAEAINKFETLKKNAAAKRAEKKAAAAAKRAEKEAEKKAKAAAKPKVTAKEVVAKGEATVKKAKAEVAKNEAK